MPHINHKLFELATTQLRSTLFGREGNREFDWETWNLLAKSQFFKTLAPPKWNGLDADIADFANGIYSLSKGSMDIPFVVSVGAQVMASSIILKFGSEIQKNKFLPGAYSGDLVLGISNAETGAGTDLKNIRSFLKMNSSTHGDVEIQKSMANNVPHADAIITSGWILSGDHNPVMSAFLVDLADGMSTSPEQAAVNCVGFRTGAVGSVKIQRSNVSAAEFRLGTHGPDVLHYCYNLERFLIPVCLWGILDGLLEESVRLCQNRKSFGKTIDNFQFNQEKIIQIYQAKETIAGLIQMTLNELESKKEFSSDDARLSLLKFKAVEDAFEAATYFLELNGGQGYQSEHLAQKLVRDILGLKFLGGTKEQHKMTIMSTIGARQDVMIKKGKDTDESQSTKAA